MNRAATRTPAPSRASLYQEITDRIIAELEAGRVPWVQPWAAANAPLAMPKNAMTGRRYSGINILILWDTVVQHGFGTQSWLTFRQAQTLGGSVRKGERGTTVVYASRFTPGEHQPVQPSQGEPRGGIPFLKRFTVFNADQCDGLPESLIAPLPPGAGRSGSAGHRQTRESLRSHGEDRRRQSILQCDTRRRASAAPDAFMVPINFAPTLAHELSHYAATRIMPRRRAKEAGSPTSKRAVVRHNPGYGTPSAPMGDRRLSATAAARRPPRHPG